MRPRSKQLAQTQVQPEVAHDKLMAGDNKAVYQLAPVLPGDRSSRKELFNTELSLDPLYRRRQHIDEPSDIQYRKRTTVPQSLPLPTSNIVRAKRSA